MSLEEGMLFQNEMNQRRRKNATTAALITLDVPST
jgi:hypothetical protein